MRVLVVEDDVLIRMLVCGLLEEAGIECAEAADAAAALALLEGDRVRPAVLVTDFDLGPGPDGRALSREARRRAPSLPTVFVTGSPECLAGHAFGARDRLVA